MPRRKKTTLPERVVREVPDEDTGKIVKITEPMEKQALEIHTRVTAGIQHMSLGIIELGIALKDMRAKKAYLAMGYGTFAEYYETELPFGKSQVFRYIQVAARFAGNKKVAHGRLLGLPYYKLRELAALSEPTLEELKTEGLITFPDGRKLSFEGLKEMASRDFFDQIRELKKGIKKRGEMVVALQDENQLLQENQREAAGQYDQMEKYVADLEKNAPAALKKSLERSRKQIQQLLSKVSEHEDLESARKAEILKGKEAWAFLLKARLAFEKLCQAITDQIELTTPTTVVELQALTEFVKGRMDEVYLIVNKRTDAEQLRKGYQRLTDKERKVLEARAEGVEFDFKEYTNIVLKETE